MQGLSLRDPLLLRAPLLLGTAATAVLCSCGLAYYRWRRSRPSAEQIERQRRLHLVKAGRLIDGTVIDIAVLDGAAGAEPGQSAEPGRAGGVDLILYRYDIAGVVYECAQDVTALRNFVDIRACRLDFPCSVRYDSREPANSIVVAENWSGLRDTATPFPMRKPAKNPAAATVPRR